MKILIIQGSPNSDSFSHSNAIHYQKQALAQGHEVQLVDLSKDDFDPILRHGYRKHMEDETYPNLMQEKIAWADHLVFFFPIWWSGEPAILKGWLDRVLTPGFAYKRNGKKIDRLLAGKTADLFLTSNGKSIFYKMFGSTVTRWKYFILRYCGMKLNHSFVLGEMDTKKMTPSYLQNYMEKCSSTIPTIK